MKKYLILFCILFIAQYAMAQNTFFKVFNTHQTDRSFDAIQASDGSLIIVGKRASTAYEEDVCGLVMKTDENGNLIKEITLAKQNWSYYFIIDKIPNLDNEFIVIGSEDSIVGADFYSSIIISHIDIDLNVISHHRTHRMKNSRILPWKHTFVNDSIFILLSGTITNTTPTTSGMIATEINFPADSLRSYVSDIDINCTPQDILYIPENNETHIFYFGSHLYDRSFIKILKLDHMLNGISTLDTPTDMVSTACATLLNDDSYLLTGTTQPASGLPTTRDIAVFKMDENGYGINGVQYNNHPDTILYGGAGTNTTILGDTVFVVGVHNLEPFAIPWQNSPSWIQITKLDMELNILGHHFYGGDAFYMPYCIIPTNDSGLFITGYTWDYNSGEMQHDIFALKLNSDGLIVDVLENASWQATEAVIFPNPASDYVNIEFSQLYQSATFQLMDIGGKMVIEKQLKANRQMVEISAIPEGTYVYRIFNKEGLDERGKVAVE